MKLRPPSRLPAWILLGVCALATGVAVSIRLAAGDGPLEAAPWLVGCLLLAAVTGCLALYQATAASIRAKAAAEVASLRELVASQDGRFKEISDSQGRFVGNIAHEIKTPLTIVLAQLDLLLRTSHDAIAVQSLAKSITEEVRHLSDLVESFLRLARPFAQSDTSNHVPVDVHDFVLESVRRSQALARTNGVSIVLTLAEPVDGLPAPEVLGDAVLLEAMIENLVRNAVRFSPRGAKVEIQVDVSVATVRVRVLDHGKGIAAENLESVFDWFFQSPGLTLPSAGTGFGLAIARRVAEHHGGTIELRNVAGHGCEFEITLPRHRPATVTPATDGAVVDPMVA